MKGLDELIDVDKSVLDYEIPSIETEEEEIDYLELGDIEIDTEIDDIFDFDEIISEREYLNSVNMDGVVNNIVFNHDKGRDYLTITIVNDRDDTYFKATFLDADALEYKEYFTEQQKVSLFNFVLTIKKNFKNKNDKSKYPSLIFDEKNGSSVK